MGGVEGQGWVCEEGETEEPILTCVRGGRGQKRGGGSKNGCVRGVVEGLQGCDSVCV